MDHLSLTFVRNYTYKCEKAKGNFLSEVDNPAKRLKLFRENVLEITQEQLATELGISNGLVGSVETGKRGLSLKLALKLHDKYRLRSEWLFEGQEPQFDPEPGFTPRFEGAPHIEPPDRDRPGVSDFSIEGHNFGLVRRFEFDASAGPGSVVQSEEVVDQVAFSNAWLHRRGLSADLSGIIMAKGDSMEPVIPDGSQMLVAFNVIPPYPKGIYVFTRGNDAYVKHLEVLDEDKLNRPTRILATSANPTVENDIFNVDEDNAFRIVARVVSVIADV